MSLPPRLVVVSGPSGVGKGTLVNKVIASHPEVVHSVSCTTRAPRPGEIDGADYRFVDDETFRGLVSSGALLEWARVHGAHYGTPEAQVDEALAAGHPIILEIDVQGGIAIREKRPDALLIFIEPPTMEELARRLMGRGTETEAEVARRLMNAVGEMEMAPLYDVRIVNDDADRAATELACEMAKA